MEQSKFELCIFDNFKKGECEFIEGYNTYKDALNRIDEIKIDDTKEHFTILEYSENLKDIINEIQLTSKKELYSQSTIEKIFYKINNIN